MTAYQKAKGLLRGRGPGIKHKYNINIGQNTHHNKTDNTTLHTERPKDNNLAREQHITTQYSSNTT